MQTTRTASIVLVALPLLGPGAADAQDTPLSANVAMVSDYAFRGVSQTDERPALQGGFDFAHASGFYAGVWGSSISWLDDIDTRGSPGSSLELDVYGGYKRPLGPVVLDVGVLRYQYPGDFDSRWQRQAGLENPSTTEAYVGVSWAFLSFKYSHAFTELFGAPDSDGSEYFDLGAAYDVMEGLTLSAHVGRQREKGPGGSYTDWKLGVTKDVAGFNVGLHYVDTNLDDAQALNADERVVLSVGKVF